MKPNNTIDLQSSTQEYFPPRYQFLFLRNDIFFESLPLTKSPHIHRCLVRSIQRYTTRPDASMKAFHINCIHDNSPHHDDTETIEYWKSSFSVNDNNKSKQIYCQSIGASLMTSRYILRPLCHIVPEWRSSDGASLRYALLQFRIICTDEPSLPFNM